MAVGRINGVAALTGFYYEKMYGHFAGTKKSGRINEVAVRRGSNVLSSPDSSRPSSITGSPLGPLFFPTPPPAPVQKFPRHKFLSLLSRVG